MNLRMPESKSGALTTWRHPKVNKWGGRQESNLRPPGPQSGALPNCAPPAIYMVRLKRFELLPHGLEGRCSIQLSYRRRSIIMRGDLERVMGIGPTRPAWKAGILPLNYTRILPYVSDSLTTLVYNTTIEQICQTNFCHFRKKNKKISLFFIF